MSIKILIFSSLLMLLRGSSMLAMEHHMFKTPSYVIIEQKGHKKDLIQRKIDGYFVDLSAEIKRGSDNKFKIKSHSCTTGKGLVLKDIDCQPLLDEYNKIILENPQWKFNQ